MARPPERPPLPFGPAHPRGPAAVISRRAADRLREGAVWVYRSEIEQLQPAPGNDAVAPGSLVTVLDSRAIPLGSALFSSASEITLRLVSAEPALTRAAYLADIAQRIEAALALRLQLATPESNACRLIFAEADALPGIVADRYHDLIILQLLTQATAQPDVRELVTRILAERLSPAAIWERPDSRIRVLEDLPPAAAEPLFSAAAEQKAATIFTLNGLRLHFDAAAGQKTGAFLDQRLNYAAAAQWAHGRALDVCTYQGGFALHLARQCTEVLGVDGSRTALEVADRNLDLNPGLPARVDWMEADAFELLREYDAAGERFGTIVLDPPAFAKAKRAAEGAARGYKELNLRAMRMLSPGGTLVTCSCSHHVSVADFTAILASAAIDSGRRVQIVETRGAAPDHPAILTLPGTSYLKCLICVVR